MEEIIELENGFTRHKSAVGSEISTAKTKMTANELKVFYQISTLVDKDDDKFMKYTISVKDFVKSFPTFSQTNIKSTRELCRALAKQTFEIENPINGNWEIYTIFSSFKFDSKAQTITISFNEEMRPYLLTLKQFTKIENVEYIKQIESKYAIRIYALLKDYRKMTYRDFDMEALHKVLQCPKSYLDYGLFRERVLETSIREINEKSDLYISEIEEIKKERRKVLKIRIHFGNKSEQIANDKIKYLLEIFYKNRANFGFSVFKGMYYINPSPNVEKRFSDIQKITSIEIDRATNYHELYLNNQDNCSLMSKNARDFLRTLCEGIHEAIVLYYDYEKNQRLPLELWQEEQDEEKARKQRIEEYKDIIRTWKGIPKED